MAETKTRTSTQIVPAAASRPIVIREGGKKDKKDAGKGRGRAIAQGVKNAAQAQENVLIGAATGGAIALAEEKMGLPTSGMVDLGLGIGLLLVGDAMKSPKMKAAAAGAAAVGGYKLGKEFAGKSPAKVQGDADGELEGDLDGDLYE